MNKKVITRLLALLIALPLMTQATFAEAIGVSVKTVEAWEAGTNKPIGIARRFLSVIKTDPDFFTKTNIVTA